MDTYFDGYTLRDLKTNLPVPQQSLPLPSSVQAELTALRAENERLRKALEFYADDASWQNRVWKDEHGRRCGRPGAVFYDSGVRASVALGRDISEGQKRWAQYDDIALTPSSQGSETDG